MYPEDELIDSMLEVMGTFDSCARDVGRDTAVRYYAPLIEAMEHRVRMIIEVEHCGLDSEARMERFYGRINAALSDIELIHCPA